MSELTVTNYATVEQLRAVAVARCDSQAGNVGPTVTLQILDVPAMLTGMP